MINQVGIDYCKKWESEYANLPADQKFPLPIWVDSAAQERIMRMGREVRAFELDPEGRDSDIERVVRAIIIEDYFRKL